MKDYDLELNNLLKKYSLFESFSRKTIGEELLKVFKESIDENKKYILFYDVHVRDIIGEAIGENILKKYYTEDFIVNGKDIHSIKSDIEDCEIIIFSFYINSEIMNTIKEVFENNFIIDIFELVPDYMKSKTVKSKYSILRRIEYLESYSKINLFNKFMEQEKVKIISKYKEEPKTVIWGGGYHTVCLLANTNVINDLNVKYIVDSNPNLSGSYINGIEVISKKKLSTIDFNAILISSFQYEEEIKQEIYRVYREKHCICLYENNNWGQLFNIELNNINKLDENSIYKELIKLYLSIRDFKSAQIIIDEYICKKYAEYEKMRKLMTELNFLLDEIQEVISNKKQSNIQFMIIDSLDKAGKDKYMKFINKLGEENIEFENAFSASTYTTESHLCMFNEKYLFEGETFFRKQITIDDCSFVKKLKQMGYNFACNNGIPVIDELFQDKIDKNNVSTPITKILWDNLCYATSNINKKNFLYSRFMERHDSYTAAMYTYIDSQLEYYNKYFGENDYLIILADHGYEYNYERRTHIPVIIKTPENKNLYVKQLFSTKDIGRVILSLVEDKFDFIENNEYVKIERTPFYNKQLIEKFKVKNLEKFVQAYRIIRTIDEIYVLFEDGTEEYYRVPDDKTNLINESKYQTEINKFREFIKNDEFPSFKLDKEHYN